MSDPAITAAIPHRPPMLLLDAIIDLQADRIHCRKTFQAEEPYCRGYSPNAPAVPGMFLCEAVLQAGAILLAGEPHAADEIPVVTRLYNVNFHLPVPPGTTVEVTAEITTRLTGAYFLQGAVAVQQNVALSLEFSVALARTA